MEAGSQLELAGQVVVEQLNVDFADRLDVVAGLAQHQDTGQVVHEVVQDHGVLALG